MYKERIKISKHFYLDEFFPKAICDSEGIKALTRIDGRLLTVADTFRDLIGRPTWINNWYFGGDIDEAGWRDPDTTTGAKRSAHKQIWTVGGKLVSLAVDLHVSKLSGKELFKTLLDNKKTFYDLGVRRVEDTTITPGWLHMDLEVTAQKGIIVVGKTSVIQLITI